PDRSCIASLTPRSYRSAASITRPPTPSAPGSLSSLDNRTRLATGVRQGRRGTPTSGENLGCGATLE
ncbi:MAG: hypothetical protein ACJ78X_15725, partial [Myxococcales bacterium]